MLGLAVTGCATEAAETPEPRTTGTPVPTTEVRSTARSADAAAPPELAGTWRRVVQGEEVLLSLRDTGYRIQRAGEMGSGSITVEGEIVTFFASSRCDGSGRYTWAIVEDRLQLTEIDDPCSGRTDVLLFGTFGRVGE